MARIVHPHPPVISAFKYAVFGLQQAGVEVVNFEPYDHQSGWDIISSLYFPDAARTQGDILEEGGEPIAHLTGGFSVKPGPSHFPLQRIGN